MRPFTHYTAQSVEQALSLLQQYGDNAGLIAGGTDLIGVLKDEILEKGPQAVINIKTIPGLDTLTLTDAGLDIGALVKLGELEQSVPVLETCPILAQAAHSVAGPEIRNMGTIGGNLCQDTRCWYYRYPHAMGGRVQCARKGSGPCLAVKGDNRYHSIFGGKKCFAVCPSDMAVALTAFDATLAVSGPQGNRSLGVDQLYDSMGTTLSSHEMITRIQVPRPVETARQGFLKFRVREAVDFAIASVACVLDIQDGICKQARIVLGAVAGAPLRAAAAESELTGRSFTLETIEKAAAAAVVDAKPLRRNEFKVQLVKALVSRVLSERVDAAGSAA